MIIAINIKWESKYIIEYFVTLKMECLVWARITNLYKIIIVGYDSNKEIKEFINKIDELLIKSKRIGVKSINKKQRKVWIIHLYFAEIQIENFKSYKGIYLSCKWIFREWLKRSFIICKSESLW